MPRILFYLSIGLTGANFWHLFSILHRTISLNPLYWIILALWFLILIGIVTVLGRKVLSGQIATSESVLTLSAIAFFTSSLTGIILGWWR